MAQQMGTGRELPRMVVVRTGWMIFYAGSQPGDEYPIRGGSFNEEEMGYEVCNFLNLDGRLQGYVRPSWQTDAFNLARIDPAVDDDTLNDVLVVFAATHPHGGQCVVGWYRRALVHRDYQEVRDKRRSFENTYFGYYFKAPITEAVLLPLDARTFEVPRGSDGMGQTNIFYAYDSSGQPKNLHWLEQLVDFVEQYAGENLLQANQKDLERAATTAAETAEASRQGQGFLRSAAVRKAIENRAMEVTQAHLKKLGWKDLANHSATQPYDLLGQKDNQQLYIEVKGTQNDGSLVFLTRNEVHWARAHYPHTVLAIVTGIEVSENNDQIEAKKGTLRLIQPWQPADTALEPLAYRFHTGLNES